MFTKKNKVNDLLQREMEGAARKKKSGVLTDYEAYELRFYKKREYIFFGMLGLFFIFHLIFNFGINYKLRYNVFFHYFIFTTVYLLLKIFIIKTSKRAYQFIFSLFAVVFILLLYPMIIFSIAIVKINFPNFNSLPLILFFGGCIIFSQILEYRDWNNRLNYLLSKRILNFTDMTYDFLLERDLENYKHNFTVWHGYSLLYILLGFGYIFITNYLTLEIRWIEFKGIAVGAFVFLYLPFGLLHFGRYIMRGILLLKLEKEKNIKIYTNLLKYVHKEKKINEWRRSKNLKPIEINNFFFNGDTSK